MATCSSSPTTVVDASGFCAKHGNDCMDFHTWLQSEHATDSILDGVTDDGSDPFEPASIDAAIPNATHYLIVERQYSADLVIYYPTKEAADHALDNSFFIDGICEEDCLDLISVDTIPAEATLASPDWEHIVPPDEDNEAQGVLVGAAQDAL